MYITSSSTSSAVIAPQQPHTSEIATTYSLTDTILEPADFEHTAPIALDIIAAVSTNTHNEPKATDTRITDRNKQSTINEPPLQAAFSPVDYHQLADPEPKARTLSCT